jgi:hypothetical protein
MARKLIDCRDFDLMRLDGTDCTITLVGEEDQLFVEALAHGGAMHGMRDSPELRDLIRAVMRDAPIALA